MTVSMEYGYYKVTENGAARYFSTLAVHGGDIVFSGLGGDDVFTNNTSRRSLAYGRFGNDTLTRIGSQVYKSSKAHVKHACRDKHLLHPSF
ncbi:MAG: hypothetical protein KDA52_14740 [Planctomycetaceae bacterium]|nr:hypothetical protein [Planctomycetaceae bacterium]